MTIIYKSPSLKDLFRVHFILKRILPIRNARRKRLIIMTQFTPNLSYLLYPLRFVFSVF